MSLIFLTFFLLIFGNETLSIAGTPGQSPQPVNICKDVVPPSHNSSLAAKIANTKSLPTEPIEFKVMSSGLESHATRMAMIRSAQETIDFVFYIFKKDFTGRMFLDELKKALDRGVKIRILLDGIGSMNRQHFALRDHFETLVAYSQRADVPGLVEMSYAHSLLDMKNVLVNSVYKFWSQRFLHPTNQQVISLNQRVHDKFMLTDRDTERPLILLGGRNNGDAYSDLELPPEGNMIDQEVLVRPRTPLNQDEANRALMQSFAKYFEMLMYDIPSRQLTGRIFGFLPNLYYQKDMESLDSISHDERYDLVSSTIREMSSHQFLETGFTPALGTIVTEFENLVKSNNVSGARWFEKRPTRQEIKTKVKEFLEKAREKISTRSLFEGSWSRRHIRGSSIWHNLKRSMSEANDVIEIFTPYPIFSNTDLRLLKKLLLTKKELKVQLYTNSRETTDNKLVQFYHDTFILPKIAEINSHPEINGRISVRRFQETYHNGVYYNFNHSKLVRIDGSLVYVTSSNFDSRSNTVNSELGLILIPDPSLAANGGQQGVNVNLSLDSDVGAQFDSNINLIKENSQSVDLSFIDNKRVNNSPQMTYLLNITEAMLYKIGFFRQL